MTSLTIDGVIYPAVFHGTYRALGCPVCLHIGWHAQGSRCYRQGRAVLDRIGTVVPDPNQDDERDYGPICPFCRQRAIVCRCQD